MIRKFFFSFIGLMIVIISFSQPNRWQQKVKYVMDIDMNVETNQFTGKQKLVDTAGRLERFQRRYKKGKSADASA